MAKYWNWNGLRPAGAVLLLAAALIAGPAPASAGTRNAHDEAMGAINDIRAVIAEVNAASNLTAHDPGPYRAAARRATNALLGTGGPDYDAGVANPGDAAGAMGHLRWLVEHAKPGDRWGPTVQGAMVNVMVAKGQLDEARSAKEPDGFRLQTSGALESLLVAIGRDSDVGVLGGLQGALATTDLGVPQGATTVSGCAPPTRAPAYGVVDGYLSYVAVPRNTGPSRLAASIGVRDVKVTSKYLMLYTAATDKVAGLCPGVHKAAASDPADPAQAKADPPAAGADPVARLYTQAQAERGRQVYDGNCAKCHGDSLQGRSAPLIAGPKFLNKAHLLDWSVGNLRGLVVSSMPRDNPGSLSPQQYSEVLAYLLAVNCYPAGTQKFPTKNTAALKKTKLRTLDGVKPENPKLGTCTLPNS